jgi:sugar O-acyltransferase (sialic acid O-acetyltransferase NeuD family)
VVPFEEIELNFDPNHHKVFVAVTYAQLNRVRARLYLQAKLKGFELASYVSSHAFVWRNAVIGENVFIFENNVIQHFVSIGNNVVLWSGNHIGHGAVIEDHCYLASHVVVSGFCRIQESSFVGVNVTIADRVTIARDCFIGAGCVITKDTDPGKIYYAAPAQVAKVGSLRFMKVKDVNDRGE